jgi:oligoribonuclease (3'-5' exoribonuclease)
MQGKDETERKRQEREEKYKKRREERRQRIRNDPEEMKRFQQNYLDYIKSNQKSIWWLPAEGESLPWDSALLEKQMKETEEYLDSVQNRWFPIGIFPRMTDNEIKNAIVEFNALKNKGIVSQGRDAFFKQIKNRVLFLTSERNAAEGIIREIAHMNSDFINTIPAGILPQDKAECYELMQKYIHLPIEEKNALSQLLAIHDKLGFVISHDAATKQYHVTSLSFLQLSEKWTEMEVLIKTGNGFGENENNIIRKFRHLQSLLFPNTFRYANTYEAAGNVQPLRYFRPSQQTVDEDLANMKNLNDLEILTIWGCNYLYGDFISKFEKNAKLRILQAAGTAIQLRHLEKLCELKNFLYLQTSDGRRVYKCQLPYYIKKCKENGHKTIFWGEKLRNVMRSSGSLTSLGEIMTESRKFREQLGLKCVPQFDNAGPIFKSAEIIDEGVVEVKFHNVISGLLVSENPDAFEIAGEDGVFQKTQNLSLSIDKESLWVRRPPRTTSGVRGNLTYSEMAPDNSPIKYIRYGKNKVPRCFEWHRC